MKKSTFKNANYNMCQNFLLKILATFWCTLASFQCFAQCQGSVSPQPLGINVTCPNDQYVLVFYDEFNSPVLDQNKWRSKYGNPAPADRVLWQECNREHQVYLENNLSVSNGTLNIVAKRETYTYSGVSETNIECNDGNTLILEEGDQFFEEFEFSSGAVEGKQAFQATTHLLMEMRCKVPKGVGLFPAFWTWHHQEIDVFEYFSTEDDGHFQTNYHSGGKMCPLNISGNDLTSDFHTYSLEITPWWIKWYFDGQLERTVSKYYTIDGIAATTDCGQSLPSAAYVLNSIFPTISERWFAPIINLAINPKYSVEDITGLPATMEVDYVRIYRKLPSNHEDNICAQRQLKGNNTICSGEQITYNFIGPILADLIWSVSSNLAIVSQTSTSITIKPINNLINGSGWIRAETNAIIPCPQTEFTKNIWIGKPIVFVNVNNNEICPVFLEGSVEPNTLLGYWQINCSSPYTIYDKVVVIDGLVNSITSYDYIYSGLNECGTSTTSGSGIMPICPHEIVLRVAPNPVNEMLNIKVDGDFLKEDIQFFTLTSHVYGIQESLQWDYQDINIDVSTYPEGMYVLSLKISENENVINKRIFIKH